MSSLTFLRSAFSQHYLLYKRIHKTFRKLIKWAPDARVKYPIDRDRTCKMPVTLIPRNNHRARRQKPTPYLIFYIQQNLKFFNFFHIHSTSPFSSTSPSSVRRDHGFNTIKPITETNAMDWDAINWVSSTLQGSWLVSIEFLPFREQIKLKPQKNIPF